MSEALAGIVRANESAVAAVREVWAPFIAPFVQEVKEQGDE